MSYLGRFSPVRAYRDLRFFLAGRERYEFGFFALALAITGFLVFAFVHDSKVERVYRPNIIYVQQWRADRTDAQIRAQQAVDQVQRDKDEADLKARQDRNRAEFKRLDDSLKKYGI